ncbi:MAG: bifunctional phosphopantothenoylcysteine decarboxylase/phosphopantothenate--cysteine ligase CoaBC [Flavobacteriia bacterium]|nr:MAG: bifunctional phosphopantothenoylcysteine decarboxylase/phosphopantothenate--cysteine ligase CoaBC [Flavobacteriia bacterium]
MSILSGKKILLGITAGIAAYKTTYLVRLFIKAGAEVKVVMTPKALEFVTPMTLSALSNNPVLWEFTNDNPEEERWNSHVDLGLWADYFVIAPATANTMSKMAKGTADNLLLATYLSAKCPVYVAPAMDLDMYKHPTTSSNIKELEAFGHAIIPAETGELASGLVGEGRMAEPEHILAFIEQHILGQLPLYGKKVLITAGPTYEAIDPVRFIGNHSSGKMGFELAKQAARLGAEVILVTGPSHQTCDGLPVNRYDVMSAEDMYNEVFRHYDGVDIAIAAAAVADYKPQTVAPQKIKKSDDARTITLVKTKDILAQMGQEKKQQFLVGFALETDNERQNAIGKLQRKNLNAIVLNSLNDKGAGFKTDTNKVTYIDETEHSIDIPLQSKTKVAEKIFNQILKQYHA